MEYLPLISIPLLYFIIAFTKPYLQKFSPFNICAICLAVSLSWLALLTLWLLGNPVSILAIGILMGMSISGTMYKMEKLFKDKKVQNFWFVRLVLIIGGFYFIVELLNRHWNAATMILIFTIILIILATFLFQGITHKEGTKKLDNCC